MSELESAFMDLVRPCWRRLLLVARNYTGSAGDARDLVQEALLRAWRNYAPGGPRFYREGWLFVILRNVAAEWARTARRRIRLEPITEGELTELVASDLAAPLELLPSFSAEAFREFLDAKVASALDSLEPAYREMIVLSAIGELDYREIAEATQCPLGTVMSRMARARRALRERLAGFAKAEGWKTEPPPGGALCDRPEQT